MLGFLRKNGDWKGCCGIYFTSIPLFVPLVLSFLEEFHLMLFNSAGFWFVFKSLRYLGMLLCMVFCIVGCLVLL